jgi:hypothetical protein
MVAITDKMHNLRVDLQQRIDENFEETKGYKNEDPIALSYERALPLAYERLSNSNSDTYSLSSINNAIDKESLREEKRLNKISKEAQKFLSSPQSTMEYKSMTSSTMHKQAISSSSSVSSVSSRMSQRVSLM